MKEHEDDHARVASPSLASSMGIYRVEGNEPK